MMDTNTGNVYGPNEFVPNNDSMVEISENEFLRLRKRNLEESRKLMRKMAQQAARRGDKR